MVDFITAEKNHTYVTFSQSAEGKAFTQLMNSNPAFAAKLVQTSDAFNPSYLSNIGNISLKPRDSKTINFPDGSSITFSHQLKKISSSIPSRKPSNQAANSNTVSPMTVSYVGVGLYQDDNVQVAAWEAGKDSCDLATQFYQIEFQDPGGNIAGYGAEITKVIPDAQAYGAGASCQYNGDVISSKGTASEQAYAQASFTLGMNFNGLVDIKTWFGYTNWNNSYTPTDTWYAPKL